MKWIKWYPIDWIHSTCRQDLEPAERAAWHDFVCLASLREPLGKFRFTNLAGLSSVLLIPESVLKSAFEKCERSKRIRIKTTPVETTITIVKYRKYQPQLSVSKKPENIEKRLQKPGVPIYSILSSILFDFSSLKWEGIKEEDLNNWAEAYPAVDIKQELLKMREWIKANPQKGRKSNYRRFITNWLRKEQDRGGTRRGTPSGPEPGTWLKTMKEREAKK